MTIDLEVADELEAEQLIVNGRYYIHPADGGKPKLYTRATSWAAMLEDSDQLRDWRCRRVAIGLGMRPDILAMVQATPADDKDSLNVYCEEAARAAGSLERANWGTAAHGFFSRINRGETLNVPPSLLADVQAAIDCLHRHGLTPVSDMIEQVLVCELLGVAGRDDVICVDSNGELIVCDLKTGDKLVEYAALQTAMQLAIYANSDTVYDHETRTHRPMPNVSKTVAYAIHQPLGTETCKLIKVDIAAGWKYASEVVTAVRAARNHGKRKSDSMFSVVPEPATWTFSGTAYNGTDAEVTVVPEPVVRMIATGGNVVNYNGVRATTVDVSAEMVHKATAETAETEADPSLRDWILGRLKALDHGDHANARAAMKARWPHGVPGFRGGHQHTKTELDAIRMVLDVVEADFEIPFGESDPTIVAPEPVAVVGRKLPPLIDEGPTVVRGATMDIFARIDALHPDVKMVLDGWAREAHAVGRNFSLKLVASRRRWNIYEAILALAPLIEFSDDAVDTDLVRATIALVVADVAMPTTSIGEALGVLTIDEAARLVDIAKAVAADPPALTYDPGTGAVRWADHPNNTNQTEGQTA